ncbi:MAG: adenylyl-sulfate kinase [Deltaproteobacteria bacterium]|nr:adenylyl-sulfate kinase [Deltaproteobacteria bacterium]
MPARGVTVWFTGLPGSGKSTLARRLAARLTARGVRHEVLDGDAVRTSLSRDLGFSRQDRDSNVARIGFVCGLLTRNDIVAVAAAVAPYARARDALKREIRDFLEIHVATPAEACEALDPTGRWAAARRGELPSFTGVDDPYEEPLAPDLRLDLSVIDLEEAVRKVEALLEDRGYLPHDPG